MKSEHGRAQDGTLQDAAPSCGLAAVTVIVPVRNEEQNLPACLRSVAWAERVFVVDSGSTDRTAAVAREHGAEVVQFRYDGGWPKKKNWALANLPIRSPWVLFLDADERVPPALREEIDAAVRSDAVDGFYVRWQFVFLERWMKHAWSHGWMLRLIRFGRGRYEDLGMRAEGGWDTEIHENLRVQGRTARLRACLLHASQRDLSFWIAKQNAFSDWNAARRIRQRSEPAPPWSALWRGDPLERRKRLKALFLKLPGKPILLFFYLYFIKLGFLDGRAGLFFCALRAAHELHTCAKVYERSLRRRAERQAKRAT